MMQKGTYTKYTGQETEVLLPEYMENTQTLAVVGSKAFLSCKSVERLVLPPTVESVMDWGFAHMKNLREIVMPAGEIHFGKQVFLGCDSLQRVLLYSVKKYRETADIYFLEEISGLDKLRASMFRFFPLAIEGWAQQPEDPDAQEQWLERYDEALADYLNRPDEEGFVPAFIGWFDVEDVDDQKQGYLKKVRLSKISLAFQRMLCAGRPKEHILTQLQHVISQRPELVQEFLTDSEECGRDVRYYKIWQECGGLDRAMGEILLEQLPWQEPEIRSFLVDLIHSQESEVYFEQFEL